MPQHKSRAYVLDAADYGETSKLLHIFCEREGRISLIARGLRSPKSKKATAAEPFTLGQITYTLKDGATLGTLGTIETEKVYAGIRANLVSYAIANYWFEIINVASQARLASPELFSLSENLLPLLESSQGIDPSVPRFFARLAEALGFGIQVESCQVCGLRNQLEHFDVTSGAAICARCARPRTRYLPLDPKIAAALAGVWHSRPSLAQTGMAFVLLNEFFTAHLEQPMKSFPFLREILLPVPRARR